MMLVSVLLAASCIPVEGERILLSDLARALPAFAAAPGADEVGIAPAPGVRRTLGARELERMAARYNVQIGTPASACFERRAEALEQARVLEGLQQALRNEKGTWELLEYSRYPAPPGELEFLQPVRAAADVPVVVRGWVHYAPNRRFPVWAKVRITRPPRAVERGSIVAVEVSSGGAVLKLQARAETGGEVGDTVVLRNPATKICFSARVAESGKAIVDAKNDTKTPGARMRGSLGLSGR
ncbi:MAG TPA: flagella basal body P-ring formation protein FlgA [Bryobacteraceae bacterium]|nr:flagella basal body P-ring formation protein FlgA [Bryobacteraceae bacterium]